MEAAAPVKTGEELGLEGELTMALGRLVLIMVDEARGVLATELTWEETTGDVATGAGATVELAG